MGTRDGLSARTLAVAWARFQPRTLALADELGGSAAFVHHPRLARYRLLTPVRYVAGTGRTWLALARRDPGRVIVITPPVFAPLAAWAWCRLRGRSLYVDCHTDAFDSDRWRWARPVHRWLLPRADGVLLHTETAAALVRGWGARAVLVPDDVPSPAQAAEPPVHSGVTVVVAGSLDGNEPVEETLAAAALLPDIRFRVTGDVSRLPASLVARAPANVEWTGYLPYPRFLGELLAASVVAVFSTDPGIMNRAAFEAVGLGRPLVLTDFAGLRSRFGPAALFAPNEPGSMAAAIGTAVEQGEALSRRSRRLALALARHRRSALAELLSVEGATA